MSAPILDEDIILENENNNIILNDDIIYEIIKQLKIDSFNWLFVNKHWSKITVTFLWENPFQFCKPKKGFHLIRTYITCFNKEERSKLDSLFKVDYCNIYSINDCVVHDYYQKPFYEYGKYLNEFKVCEIIKSTTAWFKFISNLKQRFGNHDQFSEFNKCFMQST